MAQNSSNLSVPFQSVSRYASLLGSLVGGAVLCGWTFDVAVLKSVLGPVSILLADDHHVARRGLLALLQVAPDFPVVGEASNGLEAVQNSTNLTRR